MADAELQAFKDSRLLEWAVVPEAVRLLGVGRGRSLADGLDDAREARSRGGGRVAGPSTWPSTASSTRPADVDVMVTAGAGTGKTETMSERIVYLLATSGAHETAEGEPPGRPAG